MEINSRKNSKMKTIIKRKDSSEFLVLQVTVLVKKKCVCSLQ